MGNAVISGILFQPPSPPNALDYHGPTSSNNNNNNNNSSNGSIEKNKRHSNLSVNYLWIYSQSSTEADEWNLIPALHITHNEGGNAPSPSNTTVRYTLLYSHGNAEDLGLIASFLCDLARLLNINILCYDYSGYGVSIDQRLVSNFYQHFGCDLDTWKAWRGTNFHTNVDVRGMEGTTRSGHGFRYCREVFVAPMIQTVAGVGEFIGDEEDGFDFTNTCNWSSSNVELDGKEDGYDRQDSTQSSAMFASLHGSMHSFPPTPEDANTSPRNTSALRKLRRQLLSQHAWSTPSSSEENCYANILSTYQYLTRVECVPSQHVILYGKSVGSGPTCWLTQRLCRHNANNSGSNADKEDGSSCSSLSEHCSADEMCHVESREPTQVENRRGRSKKEGDGKKKGEGKAASALGGVVLHSPFMSVIRVVLDMGFTTLGDLFPNVDRVGDFTCPVYIIHGSNDAIVPFYHGQALFQALPDSSKTVPFWARGAGHNNIEMDMPTAFIKRLQQFIRQCDRLNYPSQLSPRKLQQQQQQRFQASLQAGMRQGTNNQGQGYAGARPTLNRYEDNYHMMMAQQGGSTGSGSSKPSKKRKQKGTLVMRSSHNSQVPPPPPPPLAALSSSQRSTRSAHAVVSGTRNWNAAATANSPPIRQSTSVQHQQLQQRAEAMLQQHQHTKQMYGSNNSHVRAYHRSVSTSAMNSSTYGRPTQKQSQQSQQQQLQRQYQRQHQQYRQMREIPTRGSSISEITEDTMGQQSFRE